MMQFIGDDFMRKINKSTYVLKSAVVSLDHLYHEGICA